MNECVHTITTSLHKTGIFWPGGVQSGLGYFTTPGIVWPSPEYPWDTLAWAKLYMGLIWARVNLACYTGTRKVKPKPIWISWGKRQWVAVGSTGPYANLQLAPVR